MPYIVWSFKSWKPIRSICCLCLPIDHNLCLSRGACFWGHTCCGSVFLLNAERNCIYIPWNWDLGTRTWNLQSKMCLNMLHSVHSNQSWVFWVARYYPRETSLLSEWVWKNLMQTAEQCKFSFKDSEHFLKPKPTLHIDL